MELNRTALTAKKMGILDMGISDMDSFKKELNNITPGSSQSGLYSNDSDAYEVFTFRRKILNMSLPDFGDIDDSFDDFKKDGMLEIPVVFARFNTQRDYRNNTIKVNSTSIDLSTPYVLTDGNEQYDYESTTALRMPNIFSNRSICWGDVALNMDAFNSPTGLATALNFVTSSRSNNDLTVRGNMINTKAFDYAYNEILDGDDEKFQDVFKFNYLNVDSLTYNNNELVCLAALIRITEAGYRFDDNDKVRKMITNFWNLNTDRDYMGVDPDEMEEAPF